MKKRNQFYYYVAVYEYQEDVYDPIGYLQKDGKIGRDSIFTTSKPMAQSLVKQIDGMGYYGVLCDIRDEKDEKVKQELMNLINR